MENACSSGTGKATSAKWAGAGSPEVDGAHEKDSQQWMQLKRVDWTVHAVSSDTGERHPVLLDGLMCRRRLFLSRA